MTVYARVITIGRNSDMPKIVRLPVGVGVDGSVIRAPITIRGDEIVCPACKGWAEDCDRCGDRGIVSIDTETVADMGCLSPATAGRPPSAIPASRPTPPGVQPVARAAGDLSRSIHNAERGTHSVLRSVPGSSASHSPAADMPPIALQGTLERVLDAITVIGGLAVFSAIAWFFLVVSV